MKQISLLNVFGCLLLFPLFSCTTCTSTTMGKPGDSRLSITKQQDMHEKRAAHTATLLPTGKVLIIGGFKKAPNGYSQLYTNTTEIFDPETGTFTYSGKLVEERCGHLATLLPDGNILVAGGNNRKYSLASAELYERKTGTFRKLPDMLASRLGPKAVLLDNGKVLITGGAEDTDPFAELYNPKSGAFEATGAAPANLQGAVTIKLDNGNVLIAGGGLDGQPAQYALIYDARKNEFSSTANMAAVRYKSAVVQLPDGNALFVGGSNNRDWKGKYVSTEIFDVTHQVFVKGPSLNHERFKLGSAVCRLPDGTVLVAGGSRYIELLAPGSTTFETVGEFDGARYFSTATVLASGKTLLAGGYGDDVQAFETAFVAEQP